MGKKDVYLEINIRSSSALTDLFDRQSTGHGWCYGSSLLSHNAKDKKSRMKLEYFELEITNYRKMECFKIKVTKNCKQ